MAHDRPLSILEIFSRSEIERAWLILGGSEAESAALTKELFDDPEGWIASDDILNALSTLTNDAAARVEALRMSQEEEAKRFAAGIQERRDAELLPPRSIGESQK